MEGTTSVLANSGRTFKHLGVVSLKGSGRGTMGSVPYHDHRHPPISVWDVQARITPTVTVSSLQCSPVESP